MASAPVADMVGAATGGSSGNSNSNMNGGSPTTVEVWNSSLEQGRLQISTLFVKCRNAINPGPTTTPVTPEQLELYKNSVRLFLAYLENDVGVSPLLKAGKVDQGLKFIKENRDKGIFPPDIADKGSQLFDRFEAESWGVNAEVEDGSESEGGAVANGGPSGGPSTSAATRARAPATQYGTTEARVPPPDHPIWGLNGIMHGLFIVGGGSKTSYRFDPRYLAEKREAKVIGHNGLVPGAWWPLQRLALFHGAHGHGVTGISGTPDAGAYSIVVSGGPMYHDMDSDLGETLFYSADNSVDNKNPLRVDVLSNRTLSLRKSRETGQPVRVLRSRGGGIHAPDVGIRYDGLYTVVREHKRFNKLGGQYLVFELHRVEGQRSFRDTKAAAPTSKQRADWGRFREGY